ncbi:unnamed protein product, partial [Iphiclides podalirius]
METPKTRIPMATLKGPPPRSILLLPANGKNVGRKGKETTALVPNSKVSRLYSKRRYSGLDERPEEKG